MSERAKWSEFRDSGLLWWVNRMLHLFGWAIVLEQRTVVGPDQEAVVWEAYPARTEFRGFTEDADARGFWNLTRHVEAEIPRMKDAIVYVARDEVRCRMVCPHGDRCRLDVGHDAKGFGCSHLRCTCNEPNKPMEG